MLGLSLEYVCHDEALPAGSASSSCESGQFSLRGLHVPYVVILHLFYPIRVHGFAISLKYFVGDVGWCG